MLTTPQLGHSLLFLQVFNNPATYVKAAKFQRLANAKEKELAALQSVKEVTVQDRVDTTVSTIKVCLRGSSQALTRRHLGTCACLTEAGGTLLQDNNGQINKHTAAAVTLGKSSQSVCTCSLLSHVCCTGLLHLCRSNSMVGQGFAAHPATPHMAFQQAPGVPTCQQLPGGRGCDGAALGGHVRPLQQPACTGGVS